MKINTIPNRQTHTHTRTLPPPNHCGASDHTAAAGGCGHRCEIINPACTHTHTQSHHRCGRLNLSLVALIPKHAPHECATYDKTTNNRPTNPHGGHNTHTKHRNDAPAESHGDAANRVRAHFIHCVRSANLLRCLWLYHISLPEVSAKHIQQARKRDEVAGTDCGTIARLCCSYLPDDDGRRTGCISTTREGGTRRMGCWCGFSGNFKLALDHHHHVDVTRKYCKPRKHLAGHALSLTRICTNTHTQTHLI